MQQAWGQAGPSLAAAGGEIAAASCLLYQCVASQPLFTTDSSTSVAHGATDREIEGLRVSSPGFFATSKGTFALMELESRTNEDD